MAEMKAAQRQSRGSHTGGGGPAGIRGAWGRLVAGDRRDTQHCQAAGGAAAHLDEAARGDLSRDVPREDLDRGDEIGLLSQGHPGHVRQPARMCLSDDHRRHPRSVFLVGGAVRQFRPDVGSGREQASEKAHAVAAAAEQMTTNVVSVAAGMEQTTTNLTSVATATEQMTATIGEIAGNSEKARRITEEATRQARRYQRTDEPARPGRAARSAKSPKPSPRFRRRPTCWRSTPPSRPPAPVRPARDSRWWPTRSRNWRSRPPPPPKTSRRGSRACSPRRPAGSPKSTRSRR